jgi:hypothetical protein
MAAVIFIMVDFASVGVFIMRTSALWRSSERFRRESRPRFGLTCFEKAKADVILDFASNVPRPSLLRLPLPLHFDLLARDSHALKQTNFLV